MLLTIWSPKGGSGTSVFAAACALALLPAPGARLLDLCGDQPAVLGMSGDPEHGVADWLALGPEAPTDALDRLAVDVCDGMRLLPHGRGTGVLDPPAEAEAGAALAVALRDAEVPTIVDAGVPATPAARALVEVADASLIVLRECYLALRNATRSGLSARARGLVVVDEPGRALSSREMTDVLGLPTVATVRSHEGVARCVDAGVLTTRMPRDLHRAATAALRAVGLGIAPHGAAA
ncbi:MAG TPA: hypothetical protein VIC35_00115 [Acidimicrobiia bacterium]